MKRIDRETVQRILDAADIVEVVSDFVSLKKRGANWVGLCPFHGDRSPSFYVSRTKGICKCFSCGKGGSPVNFVMEHEQLTYQEALKYLARKYHIEIKEHELTDEERERATERESMLAVNDFAQQHFAHNLTETPDGRDIGLAYFRERGINDLMVKRFGLGYAMDRSDDLLKAARAKGYDDKYLVETGLCSQNDQGAVYDRFRGRVIYPWYSVSGRVVAFGGRTLRKDKNVAKYVNSRDSVIYHKTDQLYGLYQAKNAIVKAGKCYLVEGYMDVISMCQVGVENVVASSGTALTDGHIRLIHRFTEKVTLIYDSDWAGIKASLRGIDLLLAQGLHIKVVLLPDGEDPDSFAQSHSGAEVEKYIAEHETDFIRFKTAILLKGNENDPMERAKVINDIVRSISVIPDAVARAEYIKECSRMLEIDDCVLLLQMQKMMADRLELTERNSRQQQDGAEAGAVAPPVVDQEQQVAGTSPAVIVHVTHTPNKLYVHEETLVKYVVKYGMLPIPLPVEDEAGQVDYEWVTVLDLVREEMAADNISFSDAVLRRVFDTAIEISTSEWPDAKVVHAAALEKARAQAISEGLETIRREALDLADIEAREELLHERVEAQMKAKDEEFAAGFLETVLLSSDDDDVRRVSTDLVFEKYQLSKVHTKYSKVETEQERLPDLVPRALLELKLAILDERIDKRRADIIACNPEDTNALQPLMNEVLDLYKLRSQFAKLLGDRIINPKR